MDHLLQTSWQHDEIYRDGRERLQLHFMMLQMQYSVSRPHESTAKAPSEWNLETDEVITWEDADFRLYGSSDDKVHLCCNLTSRFLKGKADDPKAWKTITLYEDPHGRRSQDPLLLILALALMDEVLLDITEPSHLDGLQAAALAHHGPSFISLRKDPAKADLPILRTWNERSSDSKKDRTIDPKRALTYWQALDLLHKLAKVAGYVQPFAFYAIRRHAINAISRPDVAPNDLQAAAGHMPGSTTFRRSYQSKRLTTDTQAIHGARPEDRTRLLSMGGGLEKKRAKANTQVQKARNKIWAARLEEIREDWKEAKQKSVALAVMGRTAESSGLLDADEPPSLGKPLLQSPSAVPIASTSTVQAPTTPTVIDPQTASGDESIGVAWTIGNEADAQYTELQATAASDAIQALNTKKAITTQEMPMDVRDAMFEGKDSPPPTSTLLRYLTMEWGSLPQFKANFHEDEYVTHDDNCYICGDSMLGKEVSGIAQHLHSCTRKFLEGHYARGLQDGMEGRERQVSMSMANTPAESPRIRQLWSLLCTCLATSQYFCSQRLPVLSMALRRWHTVWLRPQPR